MQRPFWHFTPSRPPRVVACAAVAGLLALAGCGSSDPTLYSLAPIASTQPSGMGGQVPAVIEVRTPGVPPSLDRQNIVGTQDDYSLTPLAGAAWSEPLAPMLGHVLATDLQQRLPGRSVFAQNDATTVPAQGFVEVEITRFARDASGVVHLGGSLSVHRAGDAEHALSVPLALTATPADSGTRAMVAALSQLAGQVADMAAERLQALPPAPAQTRR
ncbi:membrane integrity-associated transporter subunit PqiC [Komagataeibacter medellinensis]|uniref:Membrane integrity-associated transporter subunit PqiC n=1 Tax=Komagataeibacter medellinensis TaxID=1177712 RepID=A0ABQ6VVX7_9PROT|nr:PqiC family protein [Komagataeibacter medellinensis]KAB8124355.1 membrane integrity-associated transporter subunit PqiC [Komagataeibacter medellinensis]